MRPRERHPIILPLLSRTDSFGIKTSSRSGTRPATNEDVINTVFGVGSGSPSISPNSVPVTGIPSTSPITTVRVASLARVPDGSITLMTSPSLLTIVIACGVRLIMVVIMIPPFILYFVSIITRNLTSYFPSIGMRKLVMIISTLSL